MEKLMDYKEATEYLNVSRSLLWRLVRDNKIPYRRISKAIRFSKEDLDEWSKRNENNT